jgi:hypothetical protein
MIDQVLIFLKNQLNTFFKTGVNPESSTEDQVTFLDGQVMEQLKFKLGAISLLLINLEEEHVLRMPDPYVRMTSNGTLQRVNPDIRLNMMILFVAHYKQYEDSLNALGRVIRYFQTHRVLDQQNAPELSDSIEKLVIELVTLPFSAQNEVWNSLRVTYHPSVLYKVKMVVFQDEEAAPLPETSQITVQRLP